MKISPIELCERGWVPDTLLRFGIRRLCRQRLREERAGGLDAVRARYAARLEELKLAPVAIETEAANRQHYELPARFFELCLGRRLKYSCCFYPRGDELLDAAEEAMLALTADRADLADGQRILELGCGWGSLTLWLSERQPNSRITAVSNSNGQREHILAQCRARGLDNVEVITCDVNRLALERRFDRIVSVEMFEHLRNHAALMSRIAGWMEPDANLFVHVFCHRELMYPFEAEGEDNWMGRWFFTGGLMPAADTLPRFQDHLVLQQQWHLSGRHYARTANQWLANHDAHREEVLTVLADAYGPDQATRWNQRWRMFWMACAELFGYGGGDEWQVAHYRFGRR